MIFNLLQLIGGCILSFGYVFQVIQILKTKSVNDLNLKTFTSVFIGILCMEIYAINLAINKTGYMFLITNSMSLLLSGLLCILIIKYKNKEEN